MKPSIVSVLAVAAVTAMMGCVRMPMPPAKVAIIEAGDVLIRRIDRVPVQGPAYGSFEIQPGGHTMDIVVSWAEGPIPIGFGGLGAAAARTYHEELRSLCLKARGGRRYRIKTALRGKAVEAFIIDVSTGEPPVTPCGPDEDDD
jgi:hypothetical protein